MKRNYEEWMKIRESSAMNKVEEENVVNLNPRLLFKIVMVGESGVGKTCLLERYRGNIFQGEGKSDATVGVDFYSRKLRVDAPIKENVVLNSGKYSWIEDRPIVKIQIWDTAGHERFGAITRTYFRNVAGCILIYDATRIDTMEKLDSWLSSVHELSPSAQCMVVATKCDILDKVEENTIERGKIYAEKRGAMHVCLSAMESSEAEIAAAFRRISSLIYYDLIKPMIMRGDVEKALSRVGGQFNISYSEKLQGRIMRESVYLDHGVTFYLVPWIDPVTTKEIKEIEDMVKSKGGICPGCMII